MALKFKVGDNVMARCNACNMQTSYRATITEIDDNEADAPYTIKPTPCRHNDFEEEELSLVKEGIIWNLTTSFGNTFKYYKETYMSNIADKIKRARMSKDDRLLLDQGIVDNCGDLTSQGKDSLWLLLLEAHKTELVKQIQALAHEEKEKK